MSFFFSIFFNFSFFHFFMFVLFFPFLCFMNKIFTFSFHFFNFFLFFVFFFFLLFFLFQGAQNLIFFGLNGFTISYNISLKNIFQPSWRGTPLRPLFLFSPFFHVFHFLFSFLLKEKVPPFLFSCISFKYVFTAGVSIRVQLFPP